MIPQRHVVNVVTAADGSFTGYTDVLRGEVHRAHYVKTDFDNGVDFNITLETTAEPVWVESDVNADKSIAPRRALHSTAGVAALYAGGGSAVLGPVIAASERIKVVIASGGNVKSGQFIFVVG